MVRICGIFRISNGNTLILFIVFFLIIVLLSLKIFEVSFLTNRNKCIYDEPIDVVYTWVNGSDPKFLRNMEFYFKLKRENIDSSQQRFDDKNELRFSLRSLEKYAPWVNHVYLVTNGQIPYWLDLDCNKITIITHDQIFNDKSNLPTFSSPAIESNLHRIPGLSNKFIYFNDDIFLGLPVYPEDFFSTNKGYLIYLAWPVSQCAPNCPWIYVGDGQCDRSCNVVNCQFDGDDCQAAGSGQIALLEESVEVELENEIVIKEISVTDRGIPPVISKLTQRNLNISGHNSSTFSVGLNKTELSKDVYIKNSFNIKKIKNTSISKIVEEHNKKILTHNKKVSRKRRYLSENKSKTFAGLSYWDTVTNLDGYSESLQHTNRIFNKKYGFKARRVPAHGPIMIEKNIMQKLKDTFPTEFEITESNRFRHGNDMQFGFSYYYFLMSEKNVRSIDDVFDEFDTDNSGTWSDREIRNLLTKLYHLPLSYEIVGNFENILVNCSERREFFEVSPPPYERYVDSRLPTITKEMVTECPFLGKSLIKKFGSLPKYKYEVIKNSVGNEVTFKMLKSNISDVVLHLDEIRRKISKFVCLNDNLEESKASENELVLAILYDFYLSLFPHSSKFELPDESRNKFLYMDELEEWRHGHYWIKVVLILAICLSVYLVFSNSIKKLCFVAFRILFC